ncbi:hypothetical protein IWQ62_002036 [Dispira parvispora]|uniref:Fe2OG dioxygenase domain-containing protein n=1 Tax=Dispira parvispora TaxID=1520584 RepID=A0A9W8AWL4_9FUNG|nr:hypothetical protein IWQ62_002036 [Dispira parvispora]
MDSTYSDPTPPSSCSASRLPELPLALDSDHEAVTDTSPKTSCTSQQFNTAPRRTPRNKRQERLERKRQAAYRSLTKVEGVPDCTSLFDTQPTPILCIVNVGYGGINGATTEQIQAIVSAFPGFEQVVMTHGKPHSFLVFSDTQAAHHARQVLHEQQCEHLVNKVLFVDYVPLHHTAFTSPLQSHIERLLRAGHVDAPQEPTRLTRAQETAMRVDFPATMATDELIAQLRARGLYLFNDYLTVEEEQAILDYLDTQPESSWSTVNGRYVQHYGHAFNYQRRMVGTPDEAAEKEFPVVIQRVLERLRELPCFTPTTDSPPGDTPSPYYGRQAPLNYPHLNQLTASKYPVGSGIAFHSDSHISFTDTLLIISLASPITMEFRSPFYPSISQLHLQTTTTQASDIPALPNPAFIDLPPRSLIIMAGEIRYGWEHAIRARKSDLLFESGGIRPRRVRASLTLREVDFSRTCHCPWEALCDRNLGASDVTPDRAHTHTGPASKQDTLATALELPTDFP